MKFYLTSFFFLTATFLCVAQNNEPQKEKNPTEINADRLIYDGLANKAELINNVRVDDSDVTITCNRMDIYLKSDTEIRTAETTTDTGIKQSDNLSSAFALNSDGKVDRIECIGNVVIRRNSIDVYGNPVVNQRATAGKVIYYVPTEEIVLTEKPVVYNESSMMKGGIIKIYRNSSKVEVNKDVVIIQKPNPTQSRGERTSLRPGGK